jgi:hypothetical protein
MRNLIPILLLLLPLLIAADLKLSWTPNTESDLAGYNVSYDGPSSDRWSTPCGPYEYSSMGLEYNTTYTITDATPGNYAFYVRAYDDSGNMSGYNAYAGNLSEAGTWTTVGISEPDNCLPVPTVTAPAYARIPARINVGATNASTIEVDGEEVTDAYILREQGSKGLRVRAQNSTWYGVTWQEIEGIPVDSSTGRGGAGAGFR